MNPNFLKKAKASWLNMALATGSLFSMGTAQAYYRTREAYQAKAQQYMSQAVAGTQIRTDRFARLFSPDVLNAPTWTSTHELTLTRGQQVRELVIVDEAVPQQHLFHAQARPGVEIVALNASADGLNGLLDILARYQGLDAVHLVSHASAGTLRLGEEAVTKEELQAHPAAFRVINQAIKPQGDFLFYGCELGQGEDGEEFLEILQQRTHADLAASDDLTGSQYLGGNWELEITKGDIDATPLGGSLALKDFTQVLQATFSMGAPQIVSTGAYSGAPNDAQFNEDGGTNYTLTVDGASDGVYANGNYAYVGGGGGGAESSVTLSLGGTAFEPTSVYIYSSVNLSFTITSDVSGVASSTGNLYNSGETIDLSALASNTTSITITSSALGWSGHVDNFVLAGVALPITLAHFQAQRIGEAINLNWSTASEQHNTGFEVQQSADGETFERIGFVEGAGNSSEEQHYEFSVLNREAAYYRFKQIDLDGQYSYSPTRFVAAWEPVQEPFIYPNPAAGKVSIGNLTGSEMLVLDLYDMQGRQLDILQGEKPEVEQQLNQQFDNLPNGMYMVNLRVDGRSHTMKLVKK